MTWHPAQWGSLLYIKESGKTVKELMVVWGGYYLIQVFLRNTDAGNDLNQQLPLWQTCNNHHALCFLWWEHLAIIKRWQSHSESTINEPNYIFHHFSNIFSKTSLVKTTHTKKNLCFVQHCFITVGRFHIQIHAGNSHKAATEERSRSS